MNTEKIYDFFNITGEFYRNILSISTASTMYTDVVAPVNNLEEEDLSFPLYYLEYRSLEDDDNGVLLLDNNILDRLINKTLLKLPDQMRNIKAKSMDHIRKGYLKNLLGRIFEPENIILKNDDKMIIKHGKIKNEKSLSLFLKKMDVNGSMTIRYDYNICNYNNSGYTNKNEPVSIYILNNTALINKIEEFISSRKNLNMLDEMLFELRSNYQSEVTGFVDFIYKHDDLTEIMNFNQKAAQDNDIQLKRSDDLIFAKLFDIQNADEPSMKFSDLYLDEVLITNVGKIKEEGKCIATRIEYLNGIETSYTVTFHFDDKKKDSKVDKEDINTCLNIKELIYKTNIKLTSKYLKKNIEARMTTFNELDLSQAKFYDDKSIIIVLKYKMLLENGRKVQYNIFLSHVFLGEFIYRLTNSRECSRMTKELVLMNLLDLNFVLYENAVEDEELQEKMLKGTDYYNAVAIIGDGEIYNMISTVSYKYNELFDLSNADLQLYLQKINMDSRAREYFPVFLYEFLPVDIRQFFLKNMSMVQRDGVQERYEMMAGGERDCSLDPTDVITTEIEVYQELLEKNRIKISEKVKNEFNLSFKLIREYYRKEINKMNNSMELFNTFSDLSEKERREVVRTFDVSKFGYILYMSGNEITMMIKKYLNKQGGQDLDDELAYIDKNHSTEYNKAYWSKQDFLSVIDKVCLMKENYH